MGRRNYVFVSLLASWIVACSDGQANPIQQACVASVEEQLLNPETLQFRDFEEITRYQSMQIITEKFEEALGGDEYGLAPEAARKSMAQITGENRVVSFYTARVRADGKLGNTITETVACFVKSNEGCECVVSLS